jgi:hypothetical protein
MNDAYDNAQTDKEMLEKLTKRISKETWDAASKYSYPGKYEGELVICQLLACVENDETCDGYTLFNRPFEEDELDEVIEDTGIELNDADKYILLNFGGAILFEGEQGFVSATYYEKDERDKLKVDWDKIQYYADEDEDEDGDSTSEEVN